MRGSQPMNMRSPSWFGIVAALVALAACGGTPPRTTAPAPNATGADKPAPTTDAERARLQTMKETCPAYQKGDAKALANLQTEGFTLTNSVGQVTTRAQDIQIAESGNVKYDQFETSDTKVHVYGTAAVVTGRTLVKGVTGNSTFEGSFQFTDTLVLVDGRWRRAASHVSRMSSGIERTIDTPGQ